MSLKPRAAVEVNSASVRWSWSEPPTNMSWTRAQDSNSASSETTTLDVCTDYTGARPIQHALWPLAVSHVSRHDPLCAQTLAWAPRQRKS